ncbi:MAG: flagellar basal-body rod protein FlgF [Pyrinomonadaceae bacterium]|nr:flagellar basal-body rod protein FlgF [Pyrinomonadaceae bacterium]
MNYGLYTAFLGMRARQRTLEVQANNIANASTTGFKAERLNYAAIEADRKSGISTQNLVAGVSTASRFEFSEGTIQQTGRSLDVAIEGDAFIQIQTPRGTRYTRAGNLTLNNAGQLVNHQGDLVIGERGAITVPNDKGEISIGEDGSLAIGNQQFDGLKLVRFNNPAAALTKEGDTMFMLTGAEQPQQAVNSRVIQGSLESSNINSITEMVAMINNQREFENLQKNVSLLMNDLGRKIAGEIGKL